MWNDALPRNGITNWSVFYAQQNTTTTNGWLSWMKPSGVSWVYILAVGAGGGGAKSANSPLTYGPGGGGSGNVTRILIPASVIPDIIYLRPGAGGAQQSTANTNGNNGITSYISIAPNTTAQNLILSFAGGTGGVTTGAGGAGASASTSASGIWLNVGLFTSIAGQAGSNGASAAGGVGADVTFGASGLFVTGGAGGGNNNVGGGIVGAGLMPSIAGGASISNGRDGFNRGQIFGPGFKLFPLLFSGGSGGGGSNNLTGGVGGAGAYGCGGGGGGAPAGGGASGTGGQGGDSLILIGAF